MYEPEWTIQLRYVGGASTQLDYMSFTSQVPVQETTWGMVKTLYVD